MIKDVQCQDSYVTHAFIDAQNIYKGVQSDGWSLDWRKFRVYLRDKYHVEKAFIFIGYMSQYQSLYSLLEESGYVLIFKPVIMRATGEVKGNVDAELIVKCWRREGEYNKAVIVTGDGDFVPLVKILQEKGAFEHVIVPNRKYASRLLRKASGSNITFMKEIRGKVRRR
jgi:hypothetical protein